MKKIISVILILSLLVVILAGCGNKDANPTPLVPMYGNGAIPGGNVGGLTGVDTSAPETTDTPSVGDDDKLAEGFAEYTDSYVSFIHPESFSETLAMFLYDFESGASITVYEEAVSADSADFEYNAYADLSAETFLDKYGSSLADPEAIDGIKVTKSTKNGYQITVAEYFDKNESYEYGDEPAETEEPTETEALDETAEATDETLPETAEPVEEPEEPKWGYVDIYIEKDSDADFNEILISVSANEYSADSLPEGTFNLSDIVKNIIDTVTIK